MRILIVGAGKMGKAIADLAHERGDHIVAALGSADNASGKGIAAFASRADVAIEFTRPDSAVANIEAAVHAGLPVVCGTTGWLSEKQRVEEVVWTNMGALLCAPNFSLGVALFTALAERAGLMFAPHAQYGAAIVETHHAGKRDAPSGTGASLQHAVQQTLGRPVPTTSVRVGSAPGTHTLLFDGPFEQIELTHTARDRRIFADGALRAAHWLVGRQGVFSMRDVLGFHTNP